VECGLWPLHQLTGHAYSSHIQACSTGTHVLQVFLLDRTACSTGILALQERRFYRYSRSTGTFVIQVFLLYLTVSYPGITVLQDRMLHTFSYSTGTHVLQVFLLYRYYRSTGIAACSKGNLLVLQVLKRARAHFSMILLKSSYTNKTDWSKDNTEFATCSLTA
jgi:hypothetical protein